MRSDPVLFDTVTLRNLAVAESIDVCRAVHEARDPPRWTESVHREIVAGARAGADECVTVWEAAWLGAPLEPEVVDLASIRRLQIALGGASKHAGEAESIYFAERLGGMFATDDAIAYDFARNKLGTGRVLDTIDVLRSAVELGYLSPKDAAQRACSVAEAGRHLRTGRNRHPGSTYFEPSRGTA